MCQQMVVAQLLQAPSLKYKLNNPKMPIVDRIAIDVCKNC
jgi:hypothetical protein